MISALPVYYCVEYLFHDTGGHPENANRLTSIINAIDKDLVIGVVELRNPRPAKKEEICLNHEESYYKFVNEEVLVLPKGVTRHLDPDTIISPGSFIAAEKAAGAGLEMLENYFTPSADQMKESRAIALPRPPGHHAKSNLAMGFCLFNNIAITAKAAIENYGLNRIAIVDWDVHHGNGTQDSFYSDNRVLYLSTHQYPAFPGTGSPYETGSGVGEGYNVNLPLPPMSGDVEIQYCFIKTIIPILEQFDPQILLISAGYDAHERDPLASMIMTTQGFEWLAAILHRFAEDRDIPMFAFLEGGYDFIALTAGVIETMRAMRGEIEAWDVDVSGASEYAKRVVKEANSALSDYWKL